MACIPRVGLLIGHHAFDLSILYSRREVNYFFLLILTILSRPGVEILIIFFRKCQNPHPMPDPAFACPQDGCVRVFQRHSVLEKHLSSDKCTKSLEKRSLVDLAKIAYKSALEEDVGTIPTLQPVPGSERQAYCCNKEGWALKSTRKAYMFIAKQKAYLDVKFNIGQASGRKVEGEVIIRNGCKRDKTCSRT